MQHSRCNTADATQQMQHRKCNTATATILVLVCTCCVLQIIFDLISCNAEWLVFLLAIWWIPSFNIVSHNQLLVLPFFLSRIWPPAALNSAACFFNCFCCFFMVTFWSAYADGPFLSPEEQVPLRRFFLGCSAAIGCEGDFAAGRFIDRTLAAGSNDVHWQSWGLYWANIWCCSIPLMIVEPHSWGWQNSS